MVFDNSPPVMASRWEVVRDHFPILVLVFAAVGVAAGVHLASAAVIVIAVGHMVLAGVLFAIRVLRIRKAEHRSDDR
ncbi:MAG: hypothetical protein AAF962_26075 [Actinomycetota bacterium]